MTSITPNRKSGIAISTGVFCFIGVLLTIILKPWLAWGIAGLAAGVVTVASIESQSRTLWKSLAIPAAECVGAGLAAYLVLYIIG